MDFNFLRNRNLFTDPNLPDTSVAPRQGLDMSSMIQTQPEPDQSRNPNSLMDAYKQFGSMEPGPAQKSYRDFLATQPDRDNPDFKPGKMDRLSAILAGGSEGIRHGGAAGYHTAQGILDQPYQDAMSDFKVKGDRLAKSADLEEKDKLNNVKFYRDFLTDEQNRRKEDRLGKLDESTIGVNTARTANLEAQAAKLKNEGWSKVEDKNTGSSRFVRINPATSEMEFKDLGKTGLSTGERVDEYGKSRGAAAKEALPANLAIAREKGDQARATQQTKFTGILQIKQFLVDHPDWKATVGSDGKLVYTNPKDPSAAPVYTDVDTGKMSDQDKIDANLKARTALKAAPGEGKTTTTEIKDGKKIVTTNRGGAGSGKVTMTDPNGKPFKVDPSEVEDAKKHGWKVK